MIKSLGFLWISVVQTLLRVLPFPCKTGLIRIGHPDRDSAVFLTGNFQLTVARVKRALDGMDAYLLVANSHGLNVWCAASGGHLTNHEVISVLKTSGIDHLVDHRQVILPQLAATGIEGNVIHKKSGWKVVWGPVYASSIRSFLDNRLQKTEEMFTVCFPPAQRVEMAIAWAFPISLLALLFVPFWREGILPTISLVWGASLLIFSAFPWYQTRARTTGKNIGFVFFNFGEKGFLLIIWLLFILCIAGYSAIAADFSWTNTLRWSIASLVVLLILGLDLTGSTPTYKSGLHASRLLQIELNPECCEGIGFCEQVCPTRVFSMDHEQQLAVLSNPEKCVQCGACIVQCPFDALSFRSPQGDVVTPDTIRKYKMNMLGTRKKPQIRS
jgi:NAD-dependent dihydropyrimidine dehydrogenase PreA subunit